MDVGVRLLYAVGRAVYGAGAAFRRPFLRAGQACCLRSGLCRVDHTPPQESELPTSLTWCCRRLRRGSTLATRCMSTKRPRRLSGVPGREKVSAYRRPWGSRTNFLATPLSKSAYPCAASLRGRTVAFTIFAIGRRSCKIACISWRLYFRTGVWPV